MKRNLRIVQINGLRGLFIGLFAVSCLIAGFVAFPAFMAMNAWNYVSGHMISLPQINFGEGVLLWGIIIVSWFIFNKKKFIVSFNSQQELSEDEVQEVVAKIRSQVVNGSEVLQIKKNKPENKVENEKETLVKTTVQAESNENK